MFLFIIFNYLVINREEHHFLAIVCGNRSFKMSEKGNKRYVFSLDNYMYNAYYCNRCIELSPRMM